MDYLNCRESRRLLHQGVVPGSATPQRTLLGFHLATCPACRLHRTQLDDRLRSLSASRRAPASAATKRRTPRRVQPRLSYAAVGLVLGGMLALNPLSGRAAAPALATTTASAPMQRQDAARIHPARIAAAMQRQDRLSAIEPRRERVAAPSRTATAAGSAATQLETAQLRADQQLLAGQELLIPSRADDTASPTAQAATTYVVQPGDTLSGIALRVYGNANQWVAIFEANRNVLSSPHWIYPGQVLTIPQIGGVTGYYTVQPGDTLWDIAGLAYNNPLRWREIADFNGIQNPNMIFPGTVLTIPR